MGLFKTIAEGGQIWAHRIRMVRQVARMAILASLALGIVFFAFHMFQVPKIYYQAGWYYAKSLVLGKFQDRISVSSEFWRKVENRAYSKKTVEIRTDILKRESLKRTCILLQEAGKNARSDFLSVLKAFGFAVAFFLIKGLLSRRKKLVSGQKIVRPWQVASRLILFRKASVFRIGGLPLVKDSETRHILVSGGTGSGKTNCFNTLLPKIRKKKQRAIVVDTSGEFVSKYFRSGKDIILNPFDQRGVPWHPWCECKDPYDYKSLAESFIPSSPKEDENFWRKAAQEVFCSLLQLKSIEKKTSEIVKLLLYVPLHSLYKSLQDTRAASFLDMNSERTSGSIRAVAASFLECLDLFDNTKSPFSIREWVQKGDDDSWLFLTSTIGQRASLIPLISTWFSVAMRSLIQLEPNLKRRIWFIADELPSLNRLKDLEICLAESRKFGGCALLAIQSPAQLEIAYGKELTRIIIGNCSTRIAFSEQDPEIAACISKTFGEKEVKELHESISYGAHEMRDGVSLSTQSKTSPVVSPTAIQSLSTHEAFVKLPGNLPIAKVKFKYTEIEKSSEPFLPKPPIVANVVEDAIGKCPTLDTYDTFL